MQHNVANNGHFKGWFGLCNYASLHSTQTKSCFKMSLFIGLVYAQHGHELMR